MLNVSLAFCQSLFNMGQLNLTLVGPYDIFVCKPCRLESAIPLLLTTLEQLPDKNNIAVAFPDDGAFKRFHAFFPDYHTITCVKIRDGKSRIVKVKDGKYCSRNSSHCQIKCWLEVHMPVRDGQSELEGCLNRGKLTAIYPCS